MRRKSIPGPWRAAFACLFVAVEIGAACMPRVAASSPAPGAPPALAAAIERTLDDQLERFCRAADLCGAHLALTE